MGKSHDFGWGNLTSIKIERQKVGHACSVTLEIMENVKLAA